MLHIVKAADKAQIVAGRGRVPVRQNAALQESVELVFDELRQAGAKGLFGLGEEALGMLLHQAVLRGLLGAVTLVVDRGAITIRLERAVRCKMAKNAVKHPPTAAPETPASPR